MKRILLLSDLHGFSLWGLIHPKFETEDPRTGDRLSFVLNRTQKLLWRHWQDLLSNIKDDGEPDIIIFNGDLCDGPGPRNLGRTVVNSNLDMQAENTIKIIKTLPDVPMYFTQGTDYHSVGIGESRQPIEQYIAKQCDGEFGDDLLIDECGIRIHVGHPISTSTGAWQYWTTALARDLLLMALNSAEAKYGHVDLVVRSHRHNFCHAAFTSQMGIITPCWQTRTPYAVKKDLLAPPDIGWVFVEVDSPKRMLIDRSGMTQSLIQPCRVVGREAKKAKI